MTCSKESSVCSLKEDFTFPILLQTVCLVVTGSTLHTDWNRHVFVEICNANSFLLNEWIFFSFRYSSIIKRCPLKKKPDALILTTVKWLICILLSNDLRIFIGLLYWNKEFDLRKMVTLSPGRIDLLSAVMLQFSWKSFCASYRHENMETLKPAKPDTSDLCL